MKSSSRIMRNHGWRIVVIAAALALPTAFNACGKTQLTDLSQAVESAAQSSGVRVNFCLDPSFVPQQNLKTIIILDHSGSNQNNYQMNPDGSPTIVNGQINASTQYATDPLGRLRYGSVNEPNTLLGFLFQQTVSPPTDSTRRYYALIDFGSTVGHTYPGDPGSFTSDVSAFYQDVLADSRSGSSAGVTKPNDTGATNYQDALRRATTVIQNDIKAAEDCAVATAASPTCATPGKIVPSSYVVVFMSDGAPILSISGIDGNGRATGRDPVRAVAQPTADILGQVGAMASLQNNVKFVSSVNLFTIYYYAPGNVDTNGQALLNQMAQVGNGMAYSQMSGSSIDYTKFQPPVKRIKYSLADVFVTNASATWLGTRFAPDADGDGLADDVEVKWGTDPRVADTDGNGVSDFVEYQKAAGGPRQSLNYAAGDCKGFATLNVGGKIRFPASDQSGLNDCEKTILGNAAGIGNADSNGDQIPDFLEFKNGLPFQAGTAPAINVRDQDGLTTYQKIKYGLPVNMSTAQLLNPAPASYDLRMTSSDATKDCYSLNVTNFPRLGDQDVVQVDVLEKSELLNQNAVHHRALKSFGGADAVSFADWTDPAEKAARTWGTP